MTYLPMRRFFLYLVAIMDWASSKVLAWRLSNTMDAGFCVEALEDALARFGKPEIFNTDQGSQFTSNAFTGVLRAAEIKISMDGRGRCMDNVFIERLSRSVKYECVYLHAFETGSELRAGLGRWFAYYDMHAAKRSKMVALLCDRPPVDACLHGPGPRDQASAPRRAASASYMRHPNIVDSPRHTPARPSSPQGSHYFAAADMKDSADHSSSPGHDTVVPAEARH
uniref:Transposase OrfAB, subunit B n=1 Tax=Sphingomonas sp. JE1 TaxID=1628059 RepID=A0A0D5A0A1_9SPHN|nr:Transposase OrfAB, subunit B [Sphingomonas sp. JE1]